MNTTLMQVPLGILPLNENKTDEMVDIMKHVHDHYIPFQEYTEKETVSTGEVVASSRQLIIKYYLVVTN